MAVRSATEMRAISCWSSSIRSLLSTREAAILPRRLLTWRIISSISEMWRSTSASTPVEPSRTPQSVQYGCRCKDTSYCRRRHGFTESISSFQVSSKFSL